MMGLDMHLKKQVHIYVPYDKENDTEAVLIHKDRTTGAVLSEITVNVDNSISLKTASWRKANAIHNWFVDHVQGGNDDCGEYIVEEEDLIELKALCKDILSLKDAGDESAAALKAEQDLPPTSGFFFGSTEIDNDYYADLQDTVDIINDLMLVKAPKSHPDGLIYFYEIYTYSSSW